MLFFFGFLNKRPALAPGHAFPLPVPCLNKWTRCFWRPQTLSLVECDYSNHATVIYMFVPMAETRCKVLLYMGMPWGQSWDCAFWNPKACVHSYLHNVWASVLAPLCLCIPFCRMETVIVPIHGVIVANEWMNTSNQYKELGTVHGTKNVHSIGISWVTWTECFSFSKIHILKI